MHSAFEYNYFIGAGAWLLAIGAAFALLMRGRPLRLIEHMSLDPLIGRVSLTLIVVGAALALGDTHIVGPGQLLRAIPILEGIRALSRFQVLLVFGLVVLATAGFAMVIDYTTQGWRRRLAACALSLATLGPVLAQAGLLVWNLPALPHSLILDSYPVKKPGGAPLLVGAVRQRQNHRVGHELALLEAGHWVTNCRSDITDSDSVTMKPRAQSPLTSPAPLRIANLEYNKISLAYSTGQTGFVRWNLAHPDSLEFNAPIEEGRRRVRFDASHFDSAVLSATAVYPGPAQGARASLFGLAFGLIVFIVWVRSGGKAST